MCMRGKDLQLGFRTDPVYARDWFALPARALASLLSIAPLFNVFRNRFDLMCETINGLRVFLLVVFLVLLLL